MNEVNAPKMAANLGLKLSETKQAEPGEYAELISVRAGQDGKEAEVSGTFFGTSPHIVRINDQWMEARPEGFLLLMENKDRPGDRGLDRDTAGQAQGEYCQHDAESECAGIKGVERVESGFGPWGRGFERDAR